MLNYQLYNFGLVSWMTAIYPRGATAEATGMATGLAAGTGSSPVFIKVLPVT